MAIFALLQSKNFLHFLENVTRKRRVLRNGDLIIA